MEIEETISEDLVIPKKLLKNAGISNNVQIIIKRGELRVVSSPKKDVIAMLKGLGKKIRPGVSSVDIVRELRNEWEKS
ncbi:MAG: hypothetical protein KAU14_04550 [Thermoplasmata archaeon]|nr:hypothetical protein [Thermoplasmata archaeon]